ncbi:MAG TPA: hypothetical protein VN750_01105, partial [Steroidobacteraceae bacterium]|nr:hypothetical protein [Steroidobacteraceae bacterium]
RGTTSGGENQYTNIPANSTSFVDDGTHTWTSATPPATNTAVSADRFALNSNACQTANALPTGAIFTNDGNNLVLSSGIIDTTTGKLAAAYRTAQYLNLVGAEEGALS